MAMAMAMTMARPMAKAMAKARDAPTTCFRIGFEGGGFVDRLYNWLAAVFQVLDQDLLHIWLTAS